MIAGIVLYNPDKQRLAENIAAISQQVDRLLLIENGSKDTTYIDEMQLNRFTIIRNGENMGVAHALNQICEVAEENHEEWVLTLDQDSVCPEGIIAEYQRHTSDAGIGMICPAIKDRNYKEVEVENKETEYVSSCITSASMIRISAWKEVGGFCEEYFIDNVDFDMCFSLRKHGYKILKTNRVTLLHEIGHSRKVRFMGNDWMIFNHSPLRCYYITRNTLLFGKRHGMLLKNIYRSLLRVLVINLYEEQKCAKDKMIMKAYWHAFIGKYGKYTS